MLGLAGSRRRCAFVLSLSSESFHCEGYGCRAYSFSLISVVFFFLFGAIPLSEDARTDSPRKSYMRLFAYLWRAAISRRTVFLSETIFLDDCLGVGRRRTFELAGSWWFPFFTRALPLQLYPSQGRAFFCDRPPGNPSATAPTAAAVYIASRSTSSSDFWWAFHRRANRARLLSTSSTTLFGSARTRVFQARRLPFLSARKAAASPFSRGLF